MNTAQRLLYSLLTTTGPGPTESTVRAAFPFELGRIVETFAESGGVTVYGAIDGRLMVARYDREGVTHLYTADQLAPQPLAAKQPWWRKLLTYVAGRL